MPKAKKPRAKKVPVTPVALPPLQIGDLCLINLVRVSPSGSTVQDSSHTDEATVFDVSDDGNRYLVKWGDHRYHKGEWVKRANLTLLKRPKIAEQITVLENKIDDLNEKLEADKLAVEAAVKKLPKTRWERFMNWLESLGPGYVDSLTCRLPKTQFP